MHRTTVVVGIAGVVLAAATGTGGFLLGAAQGGPAPEPAIPSTSISPPPPPKFVDPDGFVAPALPKLATGPGR